MDIAFFPANIVLGNFSISLIVSPTLPKINPLFLLLSVACAKAVASNVNFLKSPANIAVAALCLSVAAVASLNAFFTKETSCVIAEIFEPKALSPAP
jgi:hypothetical protein